MTTYNLPPQATTFIGRATEIKEILDLLADPACRLLTLVGAGGMGKTRLSLEVAAQVVDVYENGVWFVELAPLASHESLVPTILTALNLQHITVGGPNPSTGRVSETESDLGRCAIRNDQISTARNRLQEALNVHKKVQNPLHELLIFQSLGQLNTRIYSYQEAEANQAALLIAERLGIQLEVAFNSIMIGWTKLRRGLTEEAIPYYQKGISTRKELGSRLQLAWATHQSAVLDEHLGNLDQAQVQYHRALEMFTFIDDQPGIYAALCELSWLSFVQQDYVSSKGFIVQAMNIANNTHHPDIPDGGPVLGLAHNLVMLGEYEDAKQKYHRAFADASLRQFPLTKLEGLAGVARLVALTGDHGLAAELVICALHHPLCGHGTKVIGEPLLAELEAELPPDVYAAAVERGQTLDLDTALRIVQEHPALQVDDDDTSE